MGKGKKDRKQGDDDWENDLDEIAKESGIDMKQQNDTEIVQPVKKEKKKKKGKSIDNELADIDNEPRQKNNKKPGFAALIVDDNVGSDRDGDNESPEEILAAKETKSKKKTKKKQPKVEDEDIAEILADLNVSDKKESESGGKKGKKKNKKLKEMEYVLHDDEEEEQIDIEKEGVNALEKESEGKETKTSSKKKDEAKHENIKEAEVVEKKKKAKLKEAVSDVDEDDSGVKTAAQKRAEKKEREKKKKEADKKKAAKKKQKPDDAKASIEISKEHDLNEGGTSSELMKSENNEDTAVVKTVEVGKVDASGSEEDDENDEKNKKKKKKKKKKDDEEKGKKIKKPGKSAILKMQEALEEVKREEERLRAEAEAKVKALEHAEDKRLEKLRLEQEKKEKKKQKDKERKERLKKEGKLLTPAQREAQRKAEIMLEAMKQQGLLVPNKEAAEKPKKVQYGKKKKQANKQQDQSPDTEPQPVVDTQQLEEDKKESNEEDKEVINIELEKTTKVADTWDVIENVKITDTWDAIENVKIADSWDVEEENKGIACKDSVVAKSEPKKLEKQLSRKSQSDAGADEDDESDDESDDEDEEESSEGSESSEEESSSEDESESDEDDRRLTPEKIKERARERIEKRKQLNEAGRSIENLRAPVICVLGHVDTGKTKILDKIRRTNVQDGEAGGITQQIGATNIPVEKIKEQTKMVKKFQEFNLKLPGLLIIDTPGHESFSNLRSRGSNLCDMAILVVDIMHGLEPQTIESINLLKRKHTPFVVALNKIDRIFEWKRQPNLQVEDTIKSQNRPTRQQFDERANIVITQLAEQGLNARLHYENLDEKTYISLVPTSAHSGEGMGDLMAIICRLTQTRLAKKLAYSEELESTVMEVKALPGLGTTIDVILVNGKLKEGDTLVTGGIDGAIVTQIRSVLTPQPMRELRVKAQYIHHQVLKAAQGAKLCGKDFEKVLAGSPVYVANHPDEIEILKEEVEEFVASSLKAIKVSERGVYVQASTLGSLEALLEFLKTSKIPYCGVNIGPVHKRDVMKCSVMLEHEPMYAVVLAFDVKVERDAQEYADKEGIKIFTAEIIYHLFDQFTAYCEDYKLKKRDQFKHLAVYPTKLRIMPQHIFNTRDPIVVGVVIEAGSLRTGTPIIVPSQNKVMIGFVTGIEANHKHLDKAMSGQEVCVKIEPTPGEAPKLYGRHFTHEDLLVSRITRESIDVMKQYFREDMTKTDWQLIIELKKLLEIM